MTKQTQVKTLLGTKLFNVREIERKAGIRSLKMYEFLNGKTKLTDSETNTVLGIIKNSNKLSKINLED